MATPPTPVHLEVVSSTQDEARSRFAGDPLLVTAARQTAGRGRTGTVWEAADRAVAASLAFTPRWPEGSWPVIAAVAGLAVAGVVGDGAQLKWPNDVVVDGAKVAGILVESDRRGVVVGIGINLWWPEPIPGAGALYRSDPGPHAGERLAVAWAADLLDRLERPADDWGRDEFERRSATVGCHVTWEPGGAGRAVGIAANGGLMVDTAAGRVVLDSGVVRTVRATGHRADAG
ncbi:MAG TPA: biotin--[acetyl-CoA-carboxylase] ligase [Acidimicrobiia bacterium]|nr:biotin--[acetyl-CoA-carboxylase] ligase [Acidimicrobiia bacterium]